MFNNEQKREVKDYLNRVSGNVYIGCDSLVRKRFNKNTKRHELIAKYAVVLIVHIDNSRGCKIFRYLESEPVYDRSLRSPKMRLMNEVYKAVECYSEMSYMLDDRAVQIHIDVNTRPECASSSIVKQAIGYVRGVTNLVPVVKPNAWAGSCTADYIARKECAQTRTT